jgi:hypothetical protein
MICGPPLLRHNLVSVVHWSNTGARIAFLRGKFIYLNEQAVFSEVIRIKAQVRVHPFLLESRLRAFVR